MLTDDTWMLLIVINSVALLMLIAAVERGMREGLKFGAIVRSIGWPLYLLLATALFLGVLFG